MVRTIGTFFLFLLLGSDLCAQTAFNQTHFQKPDLYYSPGNQPPPLVNINGMAEGKNKTSDPLVISRSILPIVSKKKSFFVPLKPVDGSTSIETNIDLSSMNIPEAVIGISYGLEGLTLGFSIETLYIIDWKEAPLDERAGLINRSFPCKQVQFTPLLPRFVKLQAIFDF